MMSFEDKREKKGKYVWSQLHRGDCFETQSGEIFTRCLSDLAIQILSDGTLYPLKNCTNETFDDDPIEKLLNMKITIEGEM